MKFINFNQTAINCISVEQWREFAKEEHQLPKRNEELEDPATKELHIVCLSYDDGVRHQPFYFHGSQRSKTVVEEDKISCKCATIRYNSIGEFWQLSILRFKTFKTLEDAIKAALLCKDKKTYLEKLQTIAENFPEFKDDIEEDIKLIEAIKSAPNNYGV